MRFSVVDPMFQSTLPRGERPLVELCDILPREFQSTLPRGERHDDRVAPVPLSCFNPRSRAGSDRLIKAFRHIIGGFNPRSRAGSDKQAEAAEDFGQVVSIHAPARGATWIRHWVFAQTSVSIHAPARGATRAAGIPQGENWFQSTLPRGERPDNSGYVAAYRGFNPRSRAGSDLR